MEERSKVSPTNIGSVEVKQSFLSSAISDISGNIQLTDTKVSIIIAAVVAVVVGLFPCCELIQRSLLKVKPCSWQGLILLVLVTLCLFSLISVFILGILTIRGHSSKIGYESKWFWSRSTREYSFVKYVEEVLEMDDNNVIVNMAAELYKLNDINRQKYKTYKYTLIFFSTFLLTVFLIFALLVLPFS